MPSPARRSSARASSIIRGVMSRPTTDAPRRADLEREVAGAARQIEHARSRRSTPARSISRAFHRRSRPNDRNRVMKSYAIGDRREQPPDVARAWCRASSNAPEQVAAVSSLRIIMGAMLPSQTVENYLKTIYLAQTALASTDELVPMGQLASALGVVPGTATTMVKTLAESGLVHYEPYMGVRLTPAGEKLASLVLRRHRLIELFLVKVLGMSWAEVHDEAERLEHAVSERLIDRIDEMLGRPVGRSARRSDSDGRGHDRAHGLSRPLTAPDGRRRSSSRASSIRTRRSCDSSSSSDLVPGRPCGDRSARRGVRRGPAARRNRAGPVDDWRARGGEGAGQPAPDVEADPETRFGAVRQDPQPSAIVFE